MTRKWFVQINNDYPQQLTAYNPKWSNGKSKEWKCTVSRPGRLKILYVFSSKDVFNHSYEITVRVGSLPIFHLGLLDGTCTSLQAEPNFQIQKSTKCEIIIRKNKNESKNKNRNVNQNTSHTTNVKLYCLCKKPWIEGEEMIGCNFCEDGWYHPMCLNMTQNDYKKALENDQWKCPECVKKSNSNQQQWTFTN